MAEAGLSKRGYFKGIGWEGFFSAAEKPDYDGHVPMAKGLGRKKADGGESQCCPTAFDRDFGEIEGKVITPDSLAE